MMLIKPEIPESDKEDKKQFNINPLYNTENC